MVALPKPRLLGEGARLDARDENAAVVAADQRDVPQQVVAEHRQLLHLLQGGADPREGRQRRAEGPAGRVANEFRARHVRWLSRRAKACG